MEPVRRYALITTAVAAVALAHALLTWPLADVVVLFVGGTLLAFAGEAVVVRLGLLEHRMRPRVAGVPVAILVAWPMTVYVCYRIALLVVPGGVPAAALAAIVGTLADVVMDPVGVEDGVWTYPEDPRSTPRFRGIPWWNFAGWLANVFVVAMLPSVV